MSLIKLSDHDMEGRIALLDSRIPFRAIRMEDSGSQGGPYTAVRFGAMGLGFDCVETPEQIEEMVKAAEREDAIWNAAVQLHCSPSSHIIRGSQASSFRDHLEIATIAYDQKVKFFADERAKAEGC